MLRWGSACRTGPPSMARIQGPKALQTLWRAQRDASVRIKHNMREYVSESVDRDSVLGMCHKPIAYPAHFSESARDAAGLAALVRAVVCMVRRAHRGLNLKLGL